METKTITAQELINLIVTHDIEALNTTERELVNNISVLNEELQQLNTTLSVLGNCGFDGCAEYKETENRVADYANTIDSRTEMLFKVRQAIKTFDERTV